MIERRAFGRRTVFKPAHVLMDDGTVAKCIVVDISEGGARLQTPTELTSAEFFLVFLEDDTATRSRIANRTDRYVGIQFLEPPRSLQHVLRRRSLQRAENAPRRAAVKA